MSAIASGNDVDGSLDRNALTVGANQLGTRNFNGVFRVTRYQGTAGVAGNKLGSRSVESSPCDSAFALELMAAGDVHSAF